MLVYRLFHAEEQQLLGTQITQHVVALEVAMCNLSGYVTNDALRESLTNKGASIELMKAIQWLHLNDIVHGNLRPSNVLIVKHHGRRPVLKLANFERARDVTALGPQISATSLLTREDWHTPESCRGIHDKSSDVFSTGCLLYYISLNGQVRFQNGIMIFDYLLFPKFSMDSSGILRKQMIQEMTVNTAAERPSITESLAHPCLWRTRKSLQFLLDTADRCKYKVGDYKLRNNLNKNSFGVIGRNWLDSVPADVGATIKRDFGNGKYYGKTISELLGCIRNQHAHYYEAVIKPSRYGLRSEVYTTRGSGFIMKWINAFPQLIRHCHEAMRSEFANHVDFIQYYTP